MYPNKEQEILIAKTIDSVILIKSMFISANSTLINFNKFS
ncbi:hypothetical protein [Brevibacillus laterosporus]